MADNATRKFKFVSPGVFIDEVDNSQLPAEPTAIGPIVIGRSSKGPGMMPVTVDSFSDFVDTFGNPVPGGDGDDVWRQGNKTAATYGPYAAQAWLRNGSPLTYVRLLGVQHPNATAASGEAGWKAGSMTTTDLADPSKGGAWGLYVWPSASYGDGRPTATTGSLAAVFYIKDGGGRVYIEGTRWDDAVTGSCCEIYHSETGTTAGSLTLVGVTDGALTGQKKYTISLDPEAPNFFRKVMPTNPTLTNNTITTTSARQNFWVGESFERFLNMSSSTSVGVLGNSGQTGQLGNSYWAAVLPMRNQQDTSDVQNDMLVQAQTSTTGWFIGQDLSSDFASYDATAQQKLFRLQARTAGEWVQNSVKISITNIKAAEGAFQTYGTFSLLVRQMTDFDNAPVIIERWDNLDLNPASPNYIARKIGDKYEVYDTTTKRNREYGQYTNTSKYIRVVMDEDVDRGGVTATYLPFGMFGPLKYRDWSWGSGSGGLNALGLSTDAKTYASASRGLTSTMVDGGKMNLYGNVGGNNNVTVGQDVLSLGAILPAARFAVSASTIYPSVPLRQKASWGSPKSPSNNYWGAWVHRTDTNVSYNEGIPDLLRIRCANVNPSDWANTSHDIATTLSGANGNTDPLQIAWVFSLDNLSGTFDTSNNNVVVDGTGIYNVDYRVGGTSLTAQSQSVNGVSYKNVLDAGYNKFTTVLAGGVDGFDVTERDPFRNTAVGASATEETSYELATLKRAINLIADADQVQYNLATMPGVTVPAVTNHLLDMVEDRADSMAIIDIEKVYTADSESSATAQARNAFTIKQSVDTLKARNINTSYGATYSPWVLIQDTISNRSLWAPPSVAALGALSHTDRTAAPWYAPAGFARGGLSEGAAGIPVLDVSRRLSSDERDSLYDAGINPIAKFPAEGIVIFGQKTLQQTRSALDRINVRRLMVYLKREISFIASRLLFAPNTRDTWTRFTGQATPLLDSVKAQFGIQDFKLILDETTTTPDLIDRNIIYAKLLVKPTRAAEFFAIDFVITNSGASFED
mgnify:CR=1 FL=1